MLDVDLLLRLQHLADSALPVGGLAHSFGLETLVDAGLLDVAGLHEFLLNYLEETGRLEAWYCAAACRLDDLTHWAALNVELAARKPARESREGSAAMGRRLLSLACTMTDLARLHHAAAGSAEVHFAPAFGFVAGTLGVPAEPAVAAFLHQSLATLISCCQRLLPLGQQHAHTLLWRFKPAIREAAHFALNSPEAPSFSPLLDIASSRHPYLPTRLFIS